MSKSRTQVKGKLNKWYDWLINHVPKPIKDGASRAFETFKDKVMGLYERVAGSTQRSTAPQPPSGVQPAQNPNHLNQQSLSKLSEVLTGPIGLMKDPR